MRIVIVIVVLLAATAAALLGPSLFESSRDDASTGEGSAGEGTGSPTLDPLRGEPGGDATPTEMPEPQRLRAERPLKVLYLAQRVTSWTRYHADALSRDPMIQVSSYERESAPGRRSLGTPVGADAPLTGAWLDEQGFDVLILSHVRPEWVDPSFWDVAAGRVRAGSLGLWVQPGMPIPLAGEERAPVVHPLLEQPALREVLPVESTHPVQGPQVPGVFGTEAPFGLTAEGERHIASRIVYWPEWSRRLWQLGASGSEPWGSKLCYPVKSVRPGSSVLVEVRPFGAESIPMYVRGPVENGRVLWFGAEDFGFDTYKKAESVDRWNVLLRNAAIWLAGRAPE